MAVAPLFQREEGLILPTGNPKGVNTIEDLARPDIRMINREKGSGVRVWLDQTLEQIGLSSTLIQGYNQVVNSHDEVAQYVGTGKVDVGLGIATCAYERGLDYIPLFSEPYELVFSNDLVADGRYAPFFEHLNSGEFREYVKKFRGYRVSPGAGQVEVI